MGGGYYIVRFPPGGKLLYSQFPGEKATMGERLLYNTGMAFGSSRPLLHQLSHTPLKKNCYMIIKCILFQ